MWRPWRVRRRLAGTVSAPAADGAGVAGVGDEGTRHQHPQGAGEDVERNSKRQEKLSRRTSKFLGIRKRDTVRERRETDRCISFIQRACDHVSLSYSVPDNVTDPLPLSALTLSCCCIALVVPKGALAPVFPYQRHTHTMRKISGGGPMDGICPRSSYHRAASKSTTIA